jgi:hypothetical protein
MMLFLFLYAYACNAHCGVALSSFPHLCMWLTECCYLFLYAYTCGIGCNVVFYSFVHMCAMLVGHGVVVHSSMLPINTFT